MVMITNNVVLNYKRNEDDHFRVLRPEDGDVFIDVGACDGIVSKKASTIAKDLKIVAVEPNPIHEWFIFDNLKGLDYTWINKGASIGPGISTLHVFSDNGKAGSFIPNYIFRNRDEPVATREVKMDTLDNILDGLLPDFVKIDVEGFGPHVFAGFTKFEPGTKFHVEYHYNLPNVLAYMLIRNINVIEIDLWEEFYGITGAIHGVAK